MSSRRRTIAASIACVVTLTGFAAACGSAASKGNDVASLGTEGPATTGTGATDGSGSPTSSSVDPQEAFVEFTKCMRENGIDLPDPQLVHASPAGSAGDGPVVVAGGPVIAANSADGPSTGAVGPAGIDPSSDEYKAANEICQPILDNAIGEIKIDPAVEAEQRANMLAFAKCMREQGIDFPDPVFSSNGGVSINNDDAGGAGPAPDSEAFQKANQACADLLGDAGMIFTAAPAGTS
jgi:hypothetical protein